MKKIAVLFITVLFSFWLKAQVKFKTVVPQIPVAVGESFQVQYIIEEPERVTDFNPPAFINFQFVTGPNVYTGSAQTANGVRQIMNSVYTLVSVKPGHFFIPGATAIVNGKLIKSNDAVVQVISKDEAAKKFKREDAVNADYFLRPGENPYDKIRKNLFLKMMVNKKTCYVGEPVLATFKLYSRLESKSDIIKNPGFYGFTVHDMVNLADKQVATENVNGKLFDVHTIRKVQLYPFRAGEFSIDAMEVKNLIEFSRSGINKKTEQEIVEGVINNTHNDATDANTSIFENDISTEPLIIHVKPLPEKDKPAIYNGATGIFTISASLVKDKLAKNEEGILEITISGKGNFVQLNAPSIQWPAGMEGFEPSIKDMLDKTTSPLSGNRVFRYSFVSTAAGLYTIPAVSFSFFNPDSGQYKTITSGEVKVNVSRNEKVNRPVLNETIAHAAGNNKKYLFIGSATLIIIVSGLFWFFYKKRKAVQEIIINPAAPIAPLSINEILAPAYLFAHADDKSFYMSLNMAVWNFFAAILHVSGSDMNKRNLAAILEQKKIDPTLIEQTQNILLQCETGMFTSANLLQDKSNLLQQTKETLENIQDALL